jgi:exodeoxyribonuclease-3
MTTLKIASWNVNSLRVRLTQVLSWLDKEKPDLLALQETKVTDDLFPQAVLQEAGYQVIFSGQKTYNGIALLSKLALTDVVKSLPHFNHEEKRLLGASLGKLRIWNVYVPNGESVSSDKYKYKLAWLEKLRTFLSEELKNHPQLILLGDFNIAPEARDVHNPAQWEGQVLFSEPERAKLHALFDLGLQDCYRLHHQDNQGFSWWDYRLNAFKRNLGLRIDLILASKNLAGSCTRSNIDITPRSSDRPSDHAPVIAVFEI